MGLAETKRNSEEGERMHDPTRRYARIDCVEFSWDLPQRPLDQGPMVRRGPLVHFGHGETRLDTLCRERTRDDRSRGLTRKIGSGSEPQVDRRVVHTRNRGINRSRVVTLVGGPPPRLR